MAKSYLINSNLYAVEVPVPRGATVNLEPQPTNHVVIIDCSGSMSYDLPKIQAQLKAKLPTLLGEEDTISIIWFSGKGEFGTLIKGEKVATAKDLSDVNKAIDRWLRPVCLTGFKEPLEEAEKLVDELGGVCSLFFMSDGYDNQWSQQQILKAVQTLGPKCASTTFVEYGYYCNHPLMVSLAEQTGGQLLHNADFRSYEPNFAAAMQKRAIGSKKITLDLKADVVRGFAFAFDNNALLTFKVEGGAVKVPEHIQSVWFLSPSKVGDVQTSDDHKGALYAAMALYAQRVDSDIVLPLLKAVGDVTYIKQFGSCFGKQKYAAFTDAVTNAAFNSALRLQDGYDPSAVPDDDAFTVLDLLRILSQDGENRLLLESKDFVYSKSSLGREQVEDLSEEDQKKVDVLEDQKIGADDKTTKKLQKEIDAIFSSVKALKFKADPIPNGVTIDKLIYNETRPNVSVQVQRYGTVDLSARKAGKHSKVPDEFKTHIFRNYTIILDGIIHLDKLPLRLSGATVRKLLDAGLPEECIQGFEGEDRAVAVTRIKKAAQEREINLTLEIKNLPVLNRTMVKAVSAKTLFETQYRLQSARGAQKVYNTVLKNELGEKTSAGFKVLYGDEETLWLKEQGLTDGGFSPRGKQSEKKDFYMGKELKVGLAGLSSIPSLNDYNGRVASKKPLTASQALLKGAADNVAAFLASDVYTKSKDQKKVFQAWLESEQKDAQKKVRELLYQVSQIRFGVVVGQVWFSEFSSLDETQLDITVDGQTLKGTVEMREIEIPI